MIAGVDRNEPTLDVRICRPSQGATIALRLTYSTKSGLLGDVGAN